MLEFIHEASKLLLSSTGNSVSSYDRIEHELVLILVARTTPTYLNHSDALSVAGFRVCLWSFSYSNGTLVPAESRTSIARVIYCGVIVGNSMILLTTSVSQACSVT